MPATNKRLWYPSFLIDEVLPEGRDSAQAWLTFLTGEEPDEDEEYLSSPFSPGDRIEFQWCERHGTTTLRIHRDGTLHSTIRCAGTPDIFDQTAPAREPDPMDSRVNSFWDYNSETYAETAEEFATLWAESDSATWDDDGFDEVEVDTAIWSETLTFLISADGKSLLPTDQPAPPEGSPQAPEA